ncbi:hypothetical protein BJX99DRAFT_253288 [Aspergillus californicus]
MVSAKLILVPCHSWETTKAFLETAPPHPDRNQKEMSKWHPFHRPAEEAERTSRAFAQNADTYQLPHPIGDAMVLAEAEKREKDKRERERVTRGVFEVADAGDLEAAAVKELERVTDEMYTAWEDLKQAIPVANSSIETKLSVFDVVSSLNMTNSNEEQKLSLVNRIKKSCGDVCKTLDSYADLFKFVPSGDKFASLVVGVMTTIVEATVRHRKIGAGFADAVDRIRAALIDTARILDICATADTTDKARVQAKVAGVLTVVLKFLIPYTRWCRSRFDRFRNSLNRNYYDDHVAGALSGLESQMMLLNQEQLSHMHKKLNVHMERDWKMNQRRKKQEKDAGDADEKRWTELLETLRTVGENGINLNKVTAEKESLIAEKKRFEQYRRDKLAELNKSKVTHLWQWSVRKASMATKSTTPQGTILEQTWEEIEAASSHLEAVADNGYPIDLPGTDDVRVSQPISERLHDWIAQDSSQWLWLCRYGNSDQISEVSIAAFYIYMLCKRLQSPLLAYRLQVDDMGLPESPGRGDNERSLALDRFTMMVYSLIRQLVWLLPERFAAQGQQFSQERFVCLDGSTSSVLDALNLVEELLVLMPEPLVCVVDGFEYIDNDLDVNGTSGYLDIFLGIFRRAGGRKKMKMLVCSDGYCKSLLDEDNIEVTEQLHITSDVELRDEADYLDLSLDLS